VCPRRVADRSTEAHALRKVLKKTSRNGKGKNPERIVQYILYIYIYFTLCWVSLPRDAPAGWCVGGPCKFSRARRSPAREPHTTHSIVLLLLLSFITTTAGRRPPRGAVVARFLRHALASRQRSVFLALFLCLPFFFVCVCVSSVIILSSVSRVNDN